MPQPDTFTSGPVKTAPSRFTTLPSAVGVEVIDHDGRTVAERATIEDAEDVATSLNWATFDGRLADELELLV